MVDIPNVPTLVKNYENSYFARVPFEKRMPLSKIKAEARANAQGLSGLYTYASFILKQILPQTADDEYLDLHAGTVGVIRKDADFAFGTITVKGTVSSVIPALTLLTRPDGTEYQTKAEVTLTDTEQEIDVIAKEKGVFSNCKTDEILTFSQPILGIETSASVVSIAGGVEVESSSNLLYRYMLKLQEPAHGGIETDYINWAVSVTGVIRAYVFPNEMGAGTVTIRIMGEDGQPSEQVLERCLDYLNSVRPIATKRIFVIAPTPKPITFQISGLTPSTTAVKEAVQAELADLIFRTAIPNGTVLISHIRQAISSASGENDHVLVSPTENITSDTNEIITFGGVTWL